MGYQFVVAKRVTFDLIFIGPSWGKYQANFDIEGELAIDIDDKSEIYKAFADVIVARLPGLGTLLDDRSVSTTGHISANTIGMRYVFQIGFLF